MNAPPPRWRSGSQIPRDGRGLSDAMWGAIAGSTTSTAPSPSIAAATKKISI
jgi:hypothetical protein